MAWRPPIFFPRTASRVDRPERVVSGRRGFLRGAAATVIGLPLLDCMLNESGTAYADGSDLPCRYFMFHTPTSLVTSSFRDGGDDFSTPIGTGADYALTRMLQPLGERGIKGDVSVVSGLYSAPIDVPGGYESDYHGEALYAILSGERSGWDRPAKMSSDQRAADALGDDTLYRGLFFQIDPTSGYHRVSFRVEDGRRRYIDPQTSPANAYRGLFSGFTPPDAEPDPAAVLARRLRVSSLSLARDEVRSLQGRLGASDRRALDEHLTNIRELERRISAIDLTPPAPTCVDPGFEGADPPDAGPDLPNQDARARLFAELVQVAFACDMTRVVMFAGTSTMTGDGMQSPLWRDRGGLHGQVQHGSETMRLAETNAWFLDVYADVVARLSATAEGEGDVLDRTAGVFMMEGGRGLRGSERNGDGRGDPNHSCDNMICVLAGRAGRLAPGQHHSVIGRDWHPYRVVNTALEAVGVPIGDPEISDVIPQLTD